MTVKLVSAGAKPEPPEEFEEKSPEIDCRVCCDEINCSDSFIGFGYSAHFNSSSIQVKMMIVNNNKEEEARAREEKRREGCWERSGNKRKEWGRRRN